MKWILLWCLIFASSCSLHCIGKHIQIYDWAYFSILFSLLTNSFVQYFFYAIQAVFSFLSNMRNSSRPWYLIILYFALYEHSQGGWRKKINNNQIGYFLCLLGRKLCFNELFTYSHWTFVQYSFSLIENTNKSFFF